MAMSVMYTTVNGVLLHENRGGVETEYTPDPLGNLIQCRDSAGTKTYEAHYWPFGEVRSETGTNPSPWGFVGLLGYLRDAATLLYVRARYYRPVLSRWQTVDPLWPKESAYGYAAAAPQLDTDASGYSVAVGAVQGIITGGIKLGIGLGFVIGEITIGWASLISILLGIIIGIGGSLCRWAKDVVQGMCKNMTGKCTCCSNAGDSCSSLYYKTFQWAVCLIARIIDLFLCNWIWRWTRTHFDEILKSLAKTRECVCCLKYLNCPRDKWMITLGALCFI